MVGTESSFPQNFEINPEEILHILTVWGSLQKWKISEQVYPIIFLRPYCEVLTVQMRSPVFRQTIPPIEKARVTPLPAKLVKYDEKGTSRFRQGASREPDGIALIGAVSN